jgi:hypothetical protein
MREALVPVTTTWTVPANAKVHESVALPEPVTLVGFVAQAVLLVAKLTIAVKPFSGVTVAVEVPALPAFTVTVVGVTLIVKS